MKSNRAIINLDTGEIIKELPQASLQTKEEHLIERLDELTIPWNTRMFAKLFISQELPDYSKDTFVLYWLKLSKKLAYATNVVSIKGRGNNNYTPMLDTEIIQYLEISESTWFRFIKESMNKGIIAKDTIEVNGLTRVQYVLNPIYSFNGSNLNYYTFELFKFDKKFNEVINQNQIDIFNILSKHKLGKDETLLIPNKEGNSGLSKEYYASNTKKLF